MGFPSTKMPNAGSPGLHDPALLQSHGRRSRQLGFEFDEIGLQQTRPVTLLERRTQDIQALQEHLRLHPTLWEQVDQGSQHCAGNEAGKDEAHLSELFTALAARAPLALEGLELAARSHVIGGLEYLSTMLKGSVPDPSKFRVLWLAIWPLIADFGLLSGTSLQDRVAIQKVLAKGF